MYENSPSGKLGNVPFDKWLFETAMRCSQWTGKSVDGTSSAALAQHMLNFNLVREVK
jgi:hypothetical protein